MTFIKGGDHNHGQLDDMWSRWYKQDLGWGRQHEYQVQCHQSISWGMFLLSLSLSLSLLLQFFSVSLLSLNIYRLAQCLPIFFFFSLPMFAISFSLSLLSFSFCFLSPSYSIVLLISGANIQRIGSSNRGQPCCYSRWSSLTGLCVCLCWCVCVCVCLL